MLDHRIDISRHNRSCGSMLYLAVHHLIFDEIEREDGLRIGGCDEMIELKI